jgi:hypothetical protein
MLVRLVARQSEFKPGGGYKIRNPTMLGAREKVNAIAFDQNISNRFGL